MKIDVVVVIKLRGGYSWWWKLVRVVRGGWERHISYTGRIPSPALPQVGDCLKIGDGRLPWIQVKEVDYIRNASGVWEPRLKCIQYDRFVDFGHDGSVWEAGKWVEENLFPAMQQAGLKLKDTDVF